ncbi:MAG: hemolysin family protein [Deferribacteraceae bacterium]|nr:hemolysin family protein [Deferribacteraceae bacterium]
MDSGSISAEIALIIGGFLLSTIFSTSEAVFTNSSNIKSKQLNKYHRLLTISLFVSTISTIVVAIAVISIAIKALSGTSLIVAVSIVVVIIAARIFRAILSVISVNLSSKKTLTVDDLEFMLDVSEEQGVLEDQKQQMLSNIFDISDIQVKKIMVSRTDMAAIPSDITKEALLELIQENDYSRIPIYTDNLDNVIGIFYLKDLIKLMRKDWDITDLMGTLHDVLFVPETKKIDEMLKEFQRTRQQIAVVVDEYGGVAGLVTMEDVLEEIVGDIRDEYDGDELESDITQISGNEYCVEALANIDNFCEYFNIIRTEDMLGYDTVGGRGVSIAGEIPTVGDEYIWRGFRLQVASMQDNKLQKIIVISLPIENEPTE